MRRILSWAKSILDSIHSATAQAISYAIVIPQVVFRYLNYETAVQIWEGFSRGSDPNNVTFVLRSQETRHAIKKTFFTNLGYLSPVLMYEISKHVFYRHVYDPEESSNESGIHYAAWMAVYSINMLAILYFRRKQFLQMKIDNAAYNSVIPKIISKNNPNEGHKKSCGCEDADIIFSDLISLLRYLSDKIFIKVIAHLLPFGEELLLLPDIYIDGRALAEYNVGNRCMKHRDEELNKNNAFSFGLGLAYRLSLAIAYRAIGINSDLIYDPLAYLVFQYFIIASLLTNKPPPGTQPGTDFFYPSHLLLNSLIDSVAKKIVPRVEQQKISNKKLQILLSDDKATKDAEEDIKKKRGPPEWIKAADSVLACWPVCLILDENYRSINSLMNTPAIRLWFEVSTSIIESKLKLIRAKREEWLPYLVNSISDDMIPERYKNTKMLIKIILDKDLGDFISLIELLIQKYRYEKVSTPKEPAEAKVFVENVEKALAEAIVGNPILHERARDNSTRKVMDKLKDSVEAEENVKSTKLPEKESALYEKAEQNLTEIIQEDYIPLHKKKNSSPSAAKKIQPSHLRQNSVFPKIREPVKVLFDEETEVVEKDWVKPFQKAAKPLAAQSSLRRRRVFH